MSQIPEIEADSIPDVLSYFDIDVARSITRISYGLANHNYVVRTDDGDYVVKFLVNQAPRTIENDVAVQRQLRQAGVGAPQYLRSDGGDYLYRGQAGLTAVISEKIDGIAPLNMSVELAADIGRHLALFHTSVVTLPQANNSGLMNPGVAIVNSEDVRRLFHQSLPRGIIHGDFHSGNVLVDPLHRDRVRAILDFEEAGENLFIIDLAVMLIGVSSSSDRESFEPALMRAGLQGYETVRRLTNKEGVWLPQAIRYASEAMINWFVAYGFDEYARQHQRRYDDFQQLFGHSFAT